MEKHIVTLSDTSHPFTSYTETDISDETDRILTSREFEAIRAFQTNWGYTGNQDMTDDLVDMLADTHTPVETLISRFARKWDVDDKIAANVWDLFTVRESAMRNEARKALFREESGKRVLRYFIGQSGWVWFVHFIVDIPEQHGDKRDTSTLFRASDGMTTLHMTNLYMSEAEAWNAVNSDISENNKLDTILMTESLTHVVELDKM